MRATDEEGELDAMATTVLAGIGADDPRPDSIRSTSSASGSPDSETVASSVLMVDGGASTSMSVALPFPFCCFDNLPSSSASALVPSLPSINFLSPSPSPAFVPSILSPRSSASTRWAISISRLIPFASSILRTLAFFSASQAHECLTLRCLFSSRRISVKDALSSEVKADWNASSESEADGAGARRRLEPAVVEEEKVE